MPLRSYWDPTCTGEDAPLCAAYFGNTFLPHIVVLKVDGIGFDMTWFGLVKILKLNPTP